MLSPPLSCRTIDTGVPVFIPLSCTDTEYWVVTHVMTTDVTAALPTVPVLTVGVQTCCVGPVELAGSGCVTTSTS